MHEEGPLSFQKSCLGSFLLQKVPLPAADCPSPLPIATKSPTARCRLPIATAHRHCRLPHCPLPPIFPLIILPHRRAAPNKGLLQSLLRTGCSSKSLLRQNSSHPTCSEVDCWKPYTFPSRPAHTMLGKQSFGRDGEKQKSAA